MANRINSEPKILSFLRTPQLSVTPKLSLNRKKLIANSSQKGDASGAPEPVGPSRQQWRIPHTPPSLTSHLHLGDLLNPIIGEAEILLLFKKLPTLRNSNVVLKTQKINGKQLSRPRSSRAFYFVTLHLYPGYSINPINSEPRMLPLYTSTKNKRDPNCGKRDSSWSAKLRPTI